MIIVCIGGGESLMRADVEHCRGRARVLGINNAYQIEPFADWLYGCDYGWWKFHIAAVREQFTGECWTQDVEAAREFGLEFVECDPYGVGLCGDAGKINGGRNGGFQAINLAFHFGARKIVLLGYDMGGRHWHPDHPKEISGPAHSADYAHYAETFPALARDLAAIGVDVVNCSRSTTLSCFRRSTIEVEV